MFITARQKTHLTAYSTWLYTTPMTSMQIPFHISFIFLKHLPTAQNSPSWLMVSFSSFSAKKSDRVFIFKRGKIKKRGKNECCGQRKVYNLELYFSLVWITWTLKICLWNHAFSVGNICPNQLNRKPDEFQLLNAQDLNKSS